MENINAPDKQDAFNWLCLIIKSKNYFVHLVLFCLASVILSKN